MENLGDIDRQTLAGAISTGTHGTGARLRNISAQVEAIELVLADGSVRELGAATEPELLRAARVGVGALGVISAVTLRCVPAFTLRPGRRAAARSRRCSTPSTSAPTPTTTSSSSSSPTPTRRWSSSATAPTAPPRPRGRAAAYLNDVVLENWALEALSATGKALPGGDPGALAARRPARLGQPRRSTAATGSSPTSAASASPRWSTACRASTGPRRCGGCSSGCARNRYPVCFPIEMRVVAGDDALLSPAHERDTAYIAVHQYRGMEWRPYFEAVEEIMDAYGGRPHWGKRHFQTAETLAPRYPRWDEFQARPRRARPRPRLRQRVHRPRPRPLGR